MNKCLNITSEETGACVLLRAAMPLQGSEVVFIVIILIIIVIIVIILIVIILIAIVLDVIVIIKIQIFKGNV